MRNEKGFTLLEAMVAMLIISVAVLALSTLLVSTIKANRASESRMDTAVIAQNILNRYAAQVSTGGGIPASAQGLVYDVDTRKITYDIAVQTTAITGVNSKAVLLKVTVHHPGMNAAAFSSQTVVMVPIL